MDDRLDIVFYAPGMPFQGDTLERRSLGGSETAALYMARALAALGHHVTVFSHCDRPGTYGGVIYRHANDWHGYARLAPHDVSIIQRTPEALSQRMNSKLNLLWCHDLVLGRNAGPFQGVMWNVDRVLVLSEFMKKQYQEVLSLPEGVFHITRNGIDTALVAKVRADLAAGRYALLDDGRIARRDGPDPVVAAAYKVDHSRLNEVIDAMPSPARDRKKLMYCARPERGLDVLLTSVLPELLRRDPALRLFLAGYDNTLPHMEAFYAHCARLAAGFGDRVVNLGFLTKDLLYAHYLTAGAYVYTTPSPTSALFREISCLSAMEAQACGLPIVATAAGALTETVAPGAGAFIGQANEKGDPTWDGGEILDPTSERYRDAFCDAVMRLVRDDAAWNRASSTGEMRGRELDWSAVAKDWEARCYEWIAAHNDDPIRLVRHYIKHSDIVAAKDLLQSLPTARADNMTRAAEVMLGPDHPRAEQAEEADALRVRLDRDWGFAGTPGGVRAQAEVSGAEQRRLHEARERGDGAAAIEGQAIAEEHQEADAQSKDALREQYEKIGRTHTDVFDAVPTEPRFQMLEAWLRERTDVRRILDVGCAHGAYAVNMANRVGRQWVGVDLDKHSIEWAEKFRTTRANDPGALRFLIGNDEIDLSAEEPFDLLWLGEVLEHVPEPTAFIEHLERWIKPGGHVLITVPYGPWEHLSYETYPHRAHLWEYDMRDLRELFGAKKTLAVHVKPYVIDQILERPLGWHVVEYQVTAGTPTGTIDLARKHRLQRPVQTVDAILMAGAGAEETLHWCLRSLKHVAEQVIIADTGMNDEGRRIAASYAPWVRVVTGSDPKEAGFETPRNEGLERATADFALWIDTDEKLVNPVAIHKYLRQNCFHGYSIRQHHFACDTTFKPDMPVRLFRRRGSPDGGRMQFYGMIHEHPEVGLNKGPGLTITLSDVHIAHVGYLMEHIRRDRFARNYPLLQRDMAKYPDRLLQKHFILRDNMLLAVYEIQQNGGQLTPQVVARCEETVAIYQQYFLGKGGYLNTDSIIYYSQALELLGRGVEVSYAIGAAKQGSALNGAQKVRFETLEDLEKEITHHAKEAATPYLNRWY